jgi:hypothetical protein
VRELWRRSRGGIGLRLRFLRAGSGAYVGESKLRARVARKRGVEFVGVRVASDGESLWIWKEWCGVGGEERKNFAGTGWRYWWFG